MKYVHYDINTYKIKGFYDSDIHGDNIPEPYVEISDTEWRRILETGCNKIDIKEKRGYKEDVIDINKLKERYINKIKEISKDVIVNNFKSNALGSYYYYQNEQHDQLNYITAANSDMSTYIKCSKDKTTWEMVEHTSEELKQLLIDNNIHKENVLTTLEKYKVKIRDTNDKETLDKLLEEFKNTVGT